MLDTSVSDKKSHSLYQKLCIDLQAIGVARPTLLRMIWCFFSSPGFMTVCLFRLAAACRNKGKSGRIAERFLLRLSHLLSACYISSTATIGSRFYLPHPVGIVIGRSIIGNNVTIYQNVSLGLRHSASSPLDDSYPTIGDNVTISAGAVLLGNIKIGNNSVIGANAVVLKDIPDNSTAIGIPARVLTRE